MPAWPGDGPGQGEILSAFDRTKEKGLENQGLIQILVETRRVSISKPKPIQINNLESPRGALCISDVHQFFVPTTGF